MKATAIIITGGYLTSINAKTAHGLIRGSDRFEIIGIIDEKSAGKDAGILLDGKNRDIPIYASIDEFARTAIAEYCIIGVATKGGIIPDSLRSVLKQALEHNMSLVNGLHEYISDIGEWAALASQKNLKIIDVRKPKRVSELHFWSGKIKEVKCPIIPVLGTDCALGKRTTTRLLTQAMTNAGYKAEMIYTGQTGWMQGARYGFIFDSTLNDFISGELEHAIVSCYEEVRPDIIFVEGQSSLRNPSGPAGSEWIVSAAATGVVLQHDPSRKQYKDMEFYPAYIPEVKDEIELIKIYGAPTVAVALNTSRVSDKEAMAYAMSYKEKLGIPVILPVLEGVTSLVPLFEKMISNKDQPPR